MAQTIDYVLLKYSRSYSPADSARFSNQPTSSDSEWQHFANPNLQLFLDNANPTRSANVKIIWVPGGGGGELQHVQQDSIVILEDINLTSFSPSYTDIQKPYSQSPPLKVVYRDSVVGFRYLHPRIVPPGALPTFRRFQICFTDPLLATQFVNSIRHACPCKASLPATLASSRTMAITTHPVAPLGSLMPVNESHISSQLQQLTPQHAAQTSHLGTRALVDGLSNHDVQSPMVLTNGQAIQNKFDTSRLPLCESKISPANTVVVATSDINCSRQVSQTSGLLPPITACSSQEGQDKPNPDQSVVHPHKSCSTAALSAGSSDPSSRSENSTQRYVASRVDSAIGVPSSTPDLTKDHYNLNEQLCSAAQAVTLPNCLGDHLSVKDLCAMPIEQLEQLVGEVIREPDFVNLMEKLDTMWQVKGIITKSSKEHRY